MGSADAPGYDGGRLAREGELVVVTFNYRTGVEGFAQIQGAPANRGLLDQVAALRWVRDNIAAFGGDPDLVTVFGQSAGAGSVASLLATPLAAGLFRRSIAQSVPGITGHTRDEYRLFLAMSGQLGTIGDGQATQSLRALGPGPDGEQAYRAAFPGASAESLYELVQNDWLFRMPTLHLAQAQAAGGGVAYLYELAWAAPANGGILGACHGLVCIPVDTSTGPDADRPCPRIGAVPSRCDSLEPRTSRLMQAPQMRAEHLLLLS